MKKYCDYYYQIKKVEGGYGWFIYNQYKDRELLEQYEEVCETSTAAEQDARDAISYHYV